MAVRAANGTGTIMQLLYYPATKTFKQITDGTQIKNEQSRRGVFASSSETRAFVVFTENSSPTDNHILVTIYEGGAWHSQWTTQLSSTDATVVQYEDTLYCFYIDAATFLLGMITRDLSYKFNPKCWMGFLNENAPLASCTIPGTHDSAAGYNVYFAKDAGAQTQISTIAEQLNEGIRFLDLRLYRTSGPSPTIMLYHGLLPLGINLATALDIVYSFLEANSRECVIICMKQANGNDAASLWSTLSSIITPKIEFWYQGKALPRTLKEVQRKIVLLRRSALDYDFGVKIPTWPDNSINSVIDIGNNQTVNFQDYWQPQLGSFSANLGAKKLAVSTLLNDQKMDKTSNGDRLYMNFTSAAGEGPLTTNSVIPIDYASGSGGPGLVGVNKSVADSVSRLLAKGVGSLPGCIIMDFPEIPNNEPLDAIIGQNFA